MLRLRSNLSGATAAGLVHARRRPRMVNPNEPAKLPIDPPSRANRLVWALLACAAITHLPSLFNPFFIDDYVYLETVKDLTPAKVADIFTSSTMGEEASGVWWTPKGPLPFYRPIGELTFALDWRLWGLHPAGYHLTNLLLHLVCVYLTWRLARKLVESDMTAFVAALVFALHPVHTEAVVWISGRFDLLVCVCALASTISYLNWRAGGPRRGWWGAASVGWFIVGLGCKETALILPAVLLGTELIIRWGGSTSVAPVSAGLRAFGRAGTPAPLRAETPAPLLLKGLVFGALGAAYLAGRFALFDGLGNLPPPYGLDRSTPLIAIKGLAWNLAQYALDFVLFIQVDAIYLADFWARHPAAMAAALLLAGAIVVMLTRLGWRRHSFRVGVVWVVLFTTPSLLAMPGERNVYLSSVGLALMAAAALEAFAQRDDAPGAPARWIRRASFAVVGLWIVMGFVEHGVTWCVTSSGEKVYRDLEAQVPDPPPGARIFVINQCPLNAVGFDQAIRLRYDRPDLAGCALSLAPAPEGTSIDRVIRLGPDSIRLERTPGMFFDSFIEKFHLFSEPAERLPAAARRMGLTLLDPPTTYVGLNRLDLRLPYPLDDPRMLLFTWDNRMIHGRADYLRLMTEAGLRRCDVLDGE